MTEQHDENASPCMCDNCILARWAADPPRGPVEWAMYRQSQVRMLEELGKL